MSLLLAAALATASAAPANAPPQRAGECRWVRGRFALYNGSAVRRIWLVGTRRIVALRDVDEDVPPAIARYQEEANPDRPPVFGDFHVCAVEPSRPGHMQHVRLIGARNLISDGRPYPRPSPAQREQR